MPAISTGIFGFPKDRAAGIILSAIKNYLSENESGLTTIRLTLFDQATINVFLDKWKMVNGI